MASVIYSGDERTMLYMHFDTQLTEHTLAALLYMMSELRLSDLLESMHRSARGVRDALRSCEQLSRATILLGVPREIHSRNLYGCC
jgi:hypothetical protein